MNDLSANKLLSTSEVAHLLGELSGRSALAGGNPYRARAYAKAAEALATVPASLKHLIATGRLREIPGVGEAISGIIEKLHRTGTHPTLEKLRKNVPAGVVEMLTIPGLRPDKIAKLHRELGIASVEDLEDAAKADRLRPVKGLGAALQRKVLEGLEIRRSAPGARHLQRAAELLEAAKRNLAQSGLGLTRIQAAGDFRRGNELVASLAIVAQAPTTRKKAETIEDNELAVHLTDACHYGATLLNATGNAAHLDELRARAAARGLSLTPEGLRKGARLIAAKSEADIYRALGLDFIQPELREGRGEIALVAAHRLPKLVEDRDVRGILHAHTVASDGSNTLEEMAEATRERGYAYFGVADHSRSAGYAGGLSIDDIRGQHAEIDRLNDRFGARFRIFKGIESDILPDGSLDYPDNVLANFDFVVASVHGQFRQESEAQTERLVRAVANPYTTILGHMTGRQLLRRKGYEIDVEKVLAASAHGVAVEINANP
jgi:DNA polymerase (family X)